MRLMSRTRCRKQKNCFFESGKRKAKKSGSGFASAEEIKNVEKEATDIGCVRYLPPLFVSSAEDPKTGRRIRTVYMKFGNQSGRFVKNDKKSRISEKNTGVCVSVFTKTYAEKQSDGRKKFFI